MDISGSLGVTNWKSIELLLIYSHHLTIMLVSTTFYCSKRDVTIVSGSQATLNTTATTWDENFSFWQTFCKWYGCHVFERKYESPHMMHLENRDFIWAILKQDEVTPSMLQLKWKPIPNSFGGFCAWCCPAQGGAKLNDALLLFTRITKSLVECALWIHGGHSGSTPAQFQQC